MGGSSQSVLDEGVSNSFRPLLNSSAIVGYGSVIKSLAVFSVIQNFVFNISSNPIISEALSVNLICGPTHKESYKDIFVTSVIIPIAITAMIVIGISLT